MAADGYTRMSDGIDLAYLAMQHAGGLKTQSEVFERFFGDNIPILVLPGGYPLERGT
ncbi:MAG: hypothetical protein CM1200mP39_05980 [Dehalococcoidia bacterium]|nr:MAG: hypothetical protein CM1200mP39_05980 [Dehalococcoidia bacterium]